MSSQTARTCTAIEGGEICGGTFDKQGYCDRCGSEEATTADPGHTPMLVNVSGPLTYPATCPEIENGAVCGGHIDTDHTCEKCGVEAQAIGHVSSSASGLPVRDHSSSTSIFDDVAGSERSVTARDGGGSLAAGDSAYNGRDDSDESSHSDSSQTGLGVGGWVMMPAPVIPSPDQAVLPPDVIEEMVRDMESKPGAVVPEEKRFCPHCQNKVKLIKGHCGKCRLPYSFSLEPRLKAGDVAGGDYDVLGPMAKGGNGWVTLARDHNLDLLVVLKSMIRSDSTGAVQAAIIERKFLAQVDHTRIAKIHRFFEQDGIGYMSIEYAGGPTLGTLRDKGTMDVLEGCSYVYAALSTSSYLRSIGITNPDNKPDNIIRVKDDIKVVDAGAFRLLADKTGKRVTVTRGYAPPEAFGYDVTKPWRGTGPQEAYFKRDINITTDCYTMGRTLMRLILDYEYVGRKDKVGKYEFSVPPQSEHKVLARNESLYRFLLRAIHVNPALRFQHPDEMRAQLLGVMRDLAASRGRDIGPFESDLFTKEGWPTEEQVGQPGDTFLSAIKPRINDSGRPAIAQAMLLPIGQRSAYLKAELDKKPKSAELGVRAVESLITDGDDAGAERLLSEVEALHRLDWRMLWLKGRLALRRDDQSTAIKAFDDVTAELPGELAPRLAAAVAYFRRNHNDDTRIAAGLFSSVARVDRQVVTPLFGLAACYERQNNHEAVVQALERVPTSSHLYTLARAKIAENLMANEKLDFEHGLQAASDIVSGIGLAGMRLHQLRAALLKTALERPLPQTAIKDAVVLGVPVQEKKLRRALASEYRACGKVSATDEERWEFVHQAHQVQPRTLFAW